MTTSTYIPVGRYTDEYCKALTENFKRDSIREYALHIEQLAKIVIGTANLG